ncbi:MAG: MltA domain-containing protein, partial [Pseudomonadota bacterium]
MLLLGACAEPEVVTTPAEPALRLQPVAFSDLDGWLEDDPSEAVGAFHRSCIKLTDGPGDHLVAEDPAIVSLAGSRAAWRGACADAEDDPGSPEEAREFFETWFQPYLVSDGGDTEGLFTGYYEPLLFGSREFGGAYTVPLHRAPDDLVWIDLGAFHPDLEGREIAGRVEGTGFVPYYARAEIEAGALNGRALELVWVDDPIARFFLQIQGSGQVQLDDGTRIRVGYAGQNGHQYHAIGRDLVAMGAMTVEEVSLQRIRDWLKANPDQADAIMHRNGSYVFFRERAELDPSEGPIG